MQNTLSIKAEKSWMTAFNDGYDCLSMKAGSDELLKTGINEAINIQKVLF